jgi:parallel beta-helix repeat protein
MKALLIFASLAALHAAFHLASSTSEAATYYVAPDGTDYGPGTESRPLRSIGKGISLLRAGDTLLIKRGVYAESIDSHVSPIQPGASWSAPVTIAAYPEHTVVLRPGSAGEVINLAQSSIRYLIIDRLVIDATNAKFGISLTNGARYVRIRNSEIKNARMSGILSANRSDYNQFINLKVHDNGTDRRDHGIYIASSHNTVESCEIYNNSGYGVHVYNGASGGRADNNLIQRSILHHNALRDESSAAMILSSGEGNAAYNNIIRRNPHGIAVSYRSVNSKIYNNVIVENVHNGVEVAGGSRSALLKNNILYRNGVNILNAGSATVSTNNLTGDPKFNNPELGDFSLRAISPAIDAGATLPEVKDDFDGVPRPQGPAYDIGAYEFKFSSPHSQKHPTLRGSGLESKPPAY